MKKSFLVFTASIVLGMVSSGVASDEFGDCPISPVKKYKKFYNDDDNKENDTRFNEPISILLVGLKRSTSSSAELYDYGVRRCCGLPDVGPETPPPSSPTKNK